MGRLSKLLIYVSLGFLVYYLIRNDLLNAPTIRYWPSVMLSIPILVFGLIGSAQAWHKLLAYSREKSTLTECIASMGLTVFSKYIPGKIWVIIGRASYIGHYRKRPLPLLSALSLNDQLISLWTGLVIGAVGLFAIGGLHVYGGLVLLSWIALSLVVFTDWGHRLAEHSCRRILGREIQVPIVPFRSTLLVIPWYLYWWLAIGVGFYLFTVGILGHDVTVLVALAFPLAATLGIMAVVAPGGLGVREGMLVVYLALSGLTIEDATTISVISRLWFLIGEAGFFAIGFGANRIIRKTA